MSDRSLGFNIFMDADTRRAEQKVGAFAESMQRRIERAVRSLPEIELDADSTPAERRIQEIRRELAQLGTQRIGIDIDAGTAAARIEQLRAELVRLGSRSNDVQVRADTAAASAALGTVSAQARRLDGQTVNITVSARDAVRTVSMLGLIVAALGAVSAAAVPAAAALAALPALGTAAASGVTALVAGFSGVGDAVKALRDEDKKAAAGTAQSASSRVNSAQAIVAAQRALEQAQIQADRAAITGAQQVADARDQATQTYERGLESVHTAEEAYTRAQEESRIAAEDLTRARDEAQEQLEDLDRTLRGAALSEQEATIRAAEAQERYNEARAKGTSGRDIEKLRIDAEQAALALENATDRHEDLREESDRAAAAGVEGSDQVVAARRRAEQATDAENRAERDLAKARDQATRDNTRAQVQLERTIQAARWSQQDAARALTDAQRNLTNAYTDTGAAGAAAGNKVKEAMAGMSPEAQSFARMLAGEVIPQLTRIRDRIQASLLPKMETSLRNLAILGPDVEDGLAGTADVLGDLAIKGSEMMSSGPWRADTRTIMAQNNRVLEDFGDAGLSVVDMIRHLIIGSGPMLERFSQFVERGAAAGATFLQVKRSTGELDKFFDDAGDTLAVFGDILGDIIVGGTQLAQTMGPAGLILLQGIAELIRWVGELAKAHPEIANVIGTVVVLSAALTKIGTIIGGLMVTIPALAGNWAALAGRIGMISPASVAATGAMTAASTAMQTAALNAGLYTERLTGSAKAGEKVATAGSKIASTLDKVGSSLPLIGALIIGATAAYDGLTTSTSEAAQALLAGGKAAADMREELARGDREAEEVGFGYGALRTKLSDAEKEMNKVRMAQDPLTRATQDAARAQKDYLFALESGDMTGAQAAYREFTRATEEQARQQRILDGHLKDTNRSLEEQIGIVLGAVEADIRYRDTVDRATQAVRENGATHDRTTEAGRRNTESLIDMARAASANEKAMRDNGTGAEEMRLFHDNARRELISVATQMGYNQTEAQKLADEYIGVRNIGTINTTFLANVQPALDAAFRMRDEINRAVQGITNEDIILRFKSDTGNVLNAAAGGAVRGPGTETSDSIPARLSHNEHVWTAREVHGAGGHGEVMRLRKMAAAGQLPGFATGGPVQWSSTETVVSAGIPEVARTNAEVIKHLVDTYGAGPGPGPGGGVERWRPVVLHALGIVGQSPLHANRTLRRMNQESGGNPTIVNKWDSNWTKGTPSVGLMQVIGPTYRAYRHPAHDVGPYSYGTSVNPLANTLSSMRYALARYGSLASAYDRAGGYDQGGMLPSGAVGWNLSGRPERVLSPEQTAAFERLVQALTTRVGAAPLVLAASGGAGAGPGGGVDLPALVPVMRAAFADALERVFAAGLKTDVDYDGLSLRLNRVAALNRRR